MKKLYEIDRWYGVRELEIIAETEDVYVYKHIDGQVLSTRKVEILHSSDMFIDKETLVKKIPHTIESLEEVINVLKSYNEL